MVPVPSIVIHLAIFCTLPLLATLLVTSLKHLTQALQRYVHGPILLPVRIRTYLCFQLNCKLEACTQIHLHLKFTLSFVISLPHLFLLVPVSTTVFPLLAQHSRPSAHIQPPSRPLPDPPPRWGPHGVFASAHASTGWETREISSTYVLRI